jgi:hypothetical protein
MMMPTSGAAFRVCGFFAILTLSTFPLPWFLAIQKKEGPPGGGRLKLTANPKALFYDFFGIVATSARCFQ